MLVEADRLYKDGDLTGARAALVDVVRKAPSDAGARMFLFQLLALNGEWEKAARQLETLAQLSPEANMLGVAYNQAIKAEEQRAKVFAGETEMEMLVPSEWAGPIAKAIGHYARGETAEGDALRDAAFDEAPDMPGDMDGTRFDWIADADPRFGPTFEAIIGGRYGLVAFDSVEKIKSEGPKDLRDYVWYPVEFAMKTGQSVAGFIPTRYPVTNPDSDLPELLGRATGWTDRDWGQEGSGQRLWSLGTEDGEDRGILTLRTLTFD